MKNFRLEQVPNSSLVKIAFEGGGEVPDALKGWYTSPATAQAAINVWKSENPDRAEVKLAGEHPHAEKTKAPKANYRSLGDM